MYNDEIESYRSTFRPSVCLSVSQSLFGFICVAISARLAMNVTVLWRLLGRGLLAATGRRSRLSLKQVRINVHRANAIIVDHVQLQLLKLTAMST